MKEQKTSSPRTFTSFCHDHELQVMMRIWLLTLTTLTLCCLILCQQQGEGVDDGDDLGADADDGQGGLNPSSDGGTGGTATNTLTKYGVDH